MHAHRHAPEVLGHADLLRGVPGLLLAQLRRRDGDVRVDVAREQLAVLQHRADVAAQALEVGCGRIMAVVRDGPLLGCFEA